VTSKLLKVLVIDDNADDRARLTEALQNEDRVRLDVQSPPTTLDARGLAGSNPDIALIDYQLTEREPGRAPASYRGSTLAAALREKAPEIPIVLITRQQMTVGGRMAPARDLLGAFDDVVVKETIYADPGGFAQTLAALTRGFRGLRECQRRDWNALVNTLGADALEADQLLLADPPPEVLEAGWRVSEAARWVRGVVMNYPGILYDSQHAAVALGLSHSAFLRPRVQASFQAARYRGVFSSSSPYFWKARFLSRARSVLRQARLADAPLADFAAAWQKVHRSKLEIAVCNSSHTTPADTLCYILKEPVKRAFSLPYHPDTRPPVMDEARVSFKAIRSDNRYDERLFPPDARGLLDSIQRGGKIQ